MAAARRREEVLLDRGGWESFVAGRHVGSRSTILGFEKAKRLDGIVERHKGTRR